VASKTGTNPAPAVRERILCGRDYSYSLRTHCATLNLPRSEWTHYFVQGLLPEIREYVILQQPENLQAAELKSKVAKLKKSVLFGSKKNWSFDAKEVSTEILQELSKVVTPKDKTFRSGRSVGQQGSYFDTSDVRQIIRE